MKQTYITPDTVGHQPAIPISVRCPKCGSIGTFESVGEHQRDAAFNYPIPDGRNVQHSFGMRKCPSRSCRTMLFVIMRMGSNGWELVDAYPKQRLEFETTNIPPQIASHLAEAITCHAENCYTASAIMVRRTLEELCADKKATGNDLKARLASLQKVMLIAAPLVEAADALRLLGNDAAHVEAKVFDKVGKDEVEVAIELAKELLKATYQYDTLLSKLKALKRP